MRMTEPGNSIGKRSRFVIKNPGDSIEEGSRTVTKNPGDSVGEGSRIVIQNPDSQTASLRIEVVSVVHGSLTTSGAAASLVVLEFILRPRQLKERIKSAVVTVQVESFSDSPMLAPQVRGFAPQGIYQVFQNESAVAKTARGGLPSQEQQQTYTKQSGTRIVGLAQLVERNFGEPNAVSWVLDENESQKDGIEASLRTAILFKRPGKEKFKLIIRIKTKCDRSFFASNFYGDPGEWAPPFIPFDPTARPISAAKIDRLNLEKEDLRKLGRVAALRSIGPTNGGDPAPQAADVPKRTPTQQPPTQEPPELPNQRTSEPPAQQPPTQEPSKSPNQRTSEPPDQQPTVQGSSDLPIEEPSNRLAEDYSFSTKKDKKRANKSKKSAGGFYGLLTGVDTKDNGRRQSAEQSEGASAQKSEPQDDRKTAVDIDAFDDLRNDDGDDERVDAEKSKKSKRDNEGFFDDDLDFSTTIAAGLQASGFDSNIVIDDPLFRRRDSPPGSKNFKPHRAPFAETVSDLTEIGDKSKKIDEHDESDSKHNELGQSAAQPDGASAQELEEPSNLPTQLFFPKRRSRPTAWKSSKEYKPLYLVESNRRGSTAQPEMEEDHNSDAAGAAETATKHNNLGQSVAQPGGASGQPSLVDPMTKDRSSYLLQSSPKPKKSEDLVSADQDKGGSAGKPESPESRKISVPADAFEDSSVAEKVEESEGYSEPRKLSKKEQRKPKKAARQQSQEEETTPSITEEIVEDPESYFETPKKSKKNKKKYERKPSPSSLLTFLAGGEQHESPAPSITSSSELGRSSSEGSRDQSKQKSELLLQKPSFQPDVHEISADETSSLESESEEAKYHAATPPYNPAADLSDELVAAVESSGSTKDQILFKFSTGLYSNSSRKYKIFETLTCLNLYNYQDRLTKLDENIRQAVTHHAEIPLEYKMELAIVLREYHEAIKAYKELTTLVELEDKDAKDAHFTLESTLKDNSYKFNIDDKRMCDVRARPPSDPVRIHVQWFLDILSGKISADSSFVYRLLNNLSGKSSEYSSFVQRLLSEHGPSYANEVLARVPPESVVPDLTLKPILEAGKITETANTFSRFIVSLVGGVFLLAPMCELTYVNSVKWRLISVVLWVLFFSFAIAASSKATNQELLLATAAYAAVLVVFIGKT
ncbi:hypothetical protein L207DRAFT_574509 [Hyaloscypha variabilis F]|uniref:DUF6594 domain-containing protein n=1 Tax=Hyaloscypha variabilis (strain UAMH 11265 / GT02V1 / F) TaxID=1149755 RepID=A0A2J6QS72_HYAVF|nr:hypothetical protein L207DRAFT_574509 [Hyaloscypha variabilis F]